jgi:DNA-binding MurR/RpiR family transcriptional regulator
MLRNGKYEELERQHGKPMPALLKEMFEIHSTQASVARALGVTQSTVSVWCAKLGLKQVTRLVPMERPDYAELFQQSA